MTGLWTVVAPTARPTKLETLNRKRLAVDASIWIYQFLKAVRDKEGNALRNSHVVGFFRRICKLLYFGIKPVFVFDGGAPVLKRETIRGRARRREGRRDDAARTAGKLLAVQVARAAEDEAKRQKEARDKVDDEEIPADQELVYVDEIGLDQQQRQAGRTFKKQDQYHLPDLSVSLADMGAPDDPRVMSQAELEAYAQQFHNGEDINLYDFSKIDFDSPFFQSLPAGDKYNILNAARLRSRLRMGYSKEQLDDMFPDRMAFSRFQIERVKERNELTQRLMHLSGMNEGEWDKGGRIAGERGTEYILVKSDGVDGGWALGVVSNRQGSKKDNAIDLEDDEDMDEDQEKSDEEEFEDVEIEGVNRVPQSWKRKRHATREVDYDISYEEAAERIAKKRKAVYEARRKAAETKNEIASIPARIETTVQPKPQEPNTMFVEQDDADDEEEIFEDVTMTIPVNEDDDDLQRAIAMSLEGPENAGGFENQDAPAKNGIEDDEDDNDFDLQAALAESRVSKYKPVTNARKPSPPRNSKSLFSGPLPFESLNLGQSLLGKKKSKKVEESLSGGFEKDNNSKNHAQQAQPLPSWFMQGTEIGTAKPNDLDQTNDYTEQTGTEDRGVGALRRHPTREVIDLEAQANIVVSSTENSPIAHDNDDWNIVDDEDHIRRQEEAEKQELQALEVEEARRKAQQEEREKRYEIARQIAAENEPPRMDEIAENVRASPPAVSDKPNNVPQKDANVNFLEMSDEEVEWSDSDHEEATKPSEANLPHTEEPAGGRMPDDQKAEDSDDDDIFEDVERSSPVPMSKLQPSPPSMNKEPSAIDQSMFLDDDEVDGDEAQQSNRNERNGAPEDDFFADDSDEELMRQLANETEEHLRFANELNNSRPKSPTQAMRDYEEELKQLRNQQKKDRRDADEVTQVMIQECQALLRLFGLPYITAPMEAEAQCAELVHLGLVDGIVTDDSDIFLFGGTRIYKNMFNAAKFVECYLTADLEKEYALDRKKLIRFAHLLGSDYTEGIPGIGPVTALEIITDFADLSEFKEWTSKVQLGVQTPSVMEGLLSTAFRKKFKRTVQRKLFLPTNFPDLRVDQAYLEPEVDSNNEDFQWGVPDLDKLRSFLMATIGWTQERTDEILVPVIRDINKRDIEGVQSNITRYFAGGVGVGAAPRRGINGYNGPSNNEVVEGAAPRNRTGKESGRMKNAYSRLRNEAERKKREAAGDIPEDDDVTIREDDAPAAETSAEASEDGDEVAEKSITKKSKRNKQSRAMAKKSGRRWKNVISE